MNRVNISLNLFRTDKKINRLLERITFINVLPVINTGLCVTVINFNESDTSRDELIKKIMGQGSQYCI